MTAEDFFHMVIIDWCVLLGQSSEVL